MRYLKAVAIGVISVGLAAHADRAKWELGAAAQTSALDDAAYHPGYGANGLVTVEKPMGAAVGGLGLKANYTNYQIHGNEIGSDLNEGGISVLGLVGPNSAYFQPRIGGHVGYDRLEHQNRMDVGADLMAAYKFNPKVGIQAGVTPSWLIKNSSSSKYATKVGVGVSFSPGM